MVIAWKKPLAAATLDALNRQVAGPRGNEDEPKVPG